MASLKSEHLADAQTRMTTQPGRLGRGILKTFRLPPVEILTTLHVAAVMLAVEICIRWVPLPRLSRILGCPVNLEPVVPGADRLPLKELPKRERRRVRCTKRVARLWPFSQGPCLRSALVGGHLLRRLNPTIRLGLATDRDDLSAHAWLEIDGRPLEHIAAYDVFHLDANPNTHGPLIVDGAMSVGDTGTDSRE